MQKRERLPETGSFERGLLMQEAAELVLAKNLTADMAARQMGTSRTNLYGLLAEARHYGLKVTLDLTEFIQPYIVYPLGDKLIEKYHNFDLYSAEVVRMAPVLSCPGEFHPTYDYYLHQVLGQTGYIRGLIRNGDLIGVGGGQVTLHLAQELLSNGYLPHPDCVVTPLTGNDYRLRKSDNYDSRLIASTLAAAISGAVRDKAADEQTTPQIGVIGLNNISLNPDYFAPLDHPYRTLPPELADALNDLRAELQQEQTTSYYYPLLETLNRVEVISPPEELQHLIAEARILKLRGLVQIVNSYTDGTSWENFKKIPIRIGIAGGLHKTFQIWSAIRMGLINYLVTDEPTCEALIKLADGENPFPFTDSQPKRLTRRELRYFSLDTPKTISGKTLVFLTEAEKVFLAEIDNFQKEHPDELINLSTIGKNLGYTRENARVTYNRLSKKLGGKLPPKETRGRSRITN